MTSTNLNNHIDVAIIGGGVAGAYTAYRLAQAAEAGTSPALNDLRQRHGRDRLSISLFEVSDRIGGRLWSYRPPDLPHLVAEIGGMCFSRLQQNVYGLCKKELGLAMGPCPYYGESNIQYLRRHHFNYSQYQKPPDRTPAELACYYPNVVPYFLTPAEQWQAPESLLLDALERGIPGLKEHLTPIQQALAARNLTKAFDAIAAFTLFLRQAHLADDLAMAGRPLDQLGYWNILADTLSTEAYQLTAVASGLFSPTRNWNLYDSLLLMLDFVLPTPYFRLLHGYQQLPETLAGRFVEMGGTVERQTRLYRLSTMAAEEQIALEIGSPQSNAARRTIYARHVVLALPQRALQLLDPTSSLFDNAQFRSDLQSVTPSAASKLFLSYDRPWWEEIPAGPGLVPDKPIRRGASVTDLPLQACYYFGVQPDGKSLLLASFNDDLNTPFWDGFLRAARFGLYNNPYRGFHTMPAQAELATPHDLVVEAQRQLKEMHQFDIPNPGSAMYFDWMSDPFGGGFHNWNPHLQSWVIMPRIRRPLPDANLYLCGEAFSARQGWVEGALNTAEMVLETYFDLPRPTWVHHNYDFGP